ncbi:MAG: SDR family NAD(P)-dependent oxidoreductase [Nitrospira sp.]|nr:SDR family NAD(P)-dependent oxidoreductase [Nitrospira sp.]MCB9711913.1 SDR family NAD(P)-dependent oxidoreductase [Nitrospiraceae bacterium]MDR4487586.1 SDR family NAD(P)-dependent oxidoreductase [Nitrospirales bacterium]MCA9464265.1 SDR family NAD(P)-dependent oxidoreductase [Nitrospira sp.]MCA9475293.1 SDR family NAD(P)-dependent oxidoreductase [Nitrospira sp.]
MAKTILVTGAAGFIGSHAVEHLWRRGDCVVGLDNLNDYYDPARKEANLQEVIGQAKQENWNGEFQFVKGDIRDRNLLKELFEKYTFDGIIHLAAMAGVRVSIDDPELYYDVNVNGTLALLDGAVGRLRPTTSQRHAPTFVFASTSSVYGDTKIIPFIPEDHCDRPLAPYAASKRASELLGFTYHHLYKLDFTGLRFFTVYGPRGRPDMMAYKVLDNIFTGCEVPLYNNGNMHRDWTYVEDIVAGLVRAVDRPLGYEILNLGRGEPVLLADFVKGIECLAGRKAHLVPAPMLDADIAYTFADISKTQKLLGYAPKVSVPEGVDRFWKWYQTAILRT